jgi:hypothetical protein
MPGGFTSRAAEANRNVHGPPINCRAHSIAWAKEPTQHDEKQIGGWAPGWFARRSRARRGRSGSECPAA